MQDEQQQDNTQQQPDSVSGPPASTYGDALQRDNAGAGADTDKDGVPDQSVPHPDDAREPFTESDLDSDVDADPVDPEADLNFDDDGNLIDPPTLPEHERRVEAAKASADPDRIADAQEQYDDARMEYARRAARRARERGDQ